MQAPHSKERKYNHKINIFLTGSSIILHRLYGARLRCAPKNSPKRLRQGLPEPGQLMGLQKPRGTYKNKKSKLPLKAGA